MAHHAYRLTEPLWRLMAEPFCYRPWEVERLTDDQIEGIFKVQSDVVRQVEQKPAEQRPVEMPTDEPPPPFIRGGGQWDYLKSQGFSDEEAEAKLRKLYGE